MNTTPAYQHLYQYLANRFPKMSTKELESNTEKWMGLMRTVRFQEWVDKQTGGVNTQG